MEKTVLVTGSSRGIGRATVKLFASKGYNVIINYVNDYNSAKELEDEIINNYKVKTLIIKCDISIEDDVIKLRDIIKDKFNNIDVLVNNASISLDSLLEDKTVENFKKVIDTNLVGTFSVTKYMEPLINDGGCIINVSSTNGIDTNYVESIDYDASKAGVISLTHNFASAYSPRIRVNSVAPGWVRTDMNKYVDENDYKDGILLKRFANPSEIASVIYFLSTDEASYINNEVIRVDGGEIR